MRRALRHVFLGLVLACALLNAQSPPQAVLRSTTQLVQVSVIVKAHKGRPAANLTRNDFEIFEQGQPKRIATFSSPAGTGAAAAQSVSRIGRFSNQGAPGQRSVNVVLLDRLNIDRVNWVRVTTQIGSFLSSHSVEGPLAVYVLDPKDGLRVIQDYSESGATLREHLRSWLNPPAAVPGAERTDEGAPLSFAKRDSFLQMPELFSLGSTQGLIDALRVITDHVGNIPGRKSFIWIAAQFPNPFSSLTTRHGYVLERYRTEMLEALNGLIAADVAIYPVDARGLMPDYDFNSTQRNIGVGPLAPGDGVSMRVPEFWSELELASRSGGKAFINSNGFAQSMQGAALDASASYTLGFYTDLKPDNKFHKLTVRTSQPGLTLRYRPGYWAFAQDGTAKPVSIANDLGRALSSPFEEQGLHVQATPRFEGTPPQQVALTVYIDTADLTVSEEKGERRAMFDVICGQKDAAGRTFAVPPFHIVATLQPDGSHNEVWLSFAKELRLRGGSRTVRVVVREVASGKLGSVDVPAPASPAAR
jgi:VWFA-related protein